MAETLYQLDLDGNLIRNIDVSGIDTAIQDIAFDGKYLWLTGNGNDKIYQVDMDGVLIRSFSTAAYETNPRGLVFDGKYLWLVGAGGT